MIFDVFAIVFMGLDTMFSHFKGIFLIFGLDIVGIIIFGYTLLFIFKVFTNSTFVPRWQAFTSKNSDSKSKDK